MTNDDINRADRFLDKAGELNLSTDDVLLVIDDALDIDSYDDSIMNELLQFARAQFQSDDDYDDFRREVSGLLAGDDACPTCELDPDDCECDLDED
jgi:hypothetical protein